MHKKVLKAKKQCYPENIDITETSAHQPLQDLLEHTAKRIVNIDSVSEVIFSTFEPKSDCELAVDYRLCCKWGFDGATGQSQYKQQFSTSNKASDHSLFSMMLVPLDLSSGAISIWRNPVPSSTRFCRQMKIIYAKDLKHLN